MEDKTSAGAAFANGEKHPELTRPLILLWGMINIPNWYMDWVLTCAQYELFMCDAPIVVYDNDNNTGQKEHTAKEMVDLKTRTETNYTRISKKIQDEASSCTITKRGFIKFPPAP